MVAAIACGNGCDRSRRQGKEKRRATIQLGLRPNAAAVLLDDARGSGQPDARSFEIFRAMQSLEGAEELVSVLHAEANPVVAHRDDNFALLSLLLDGDDGLRPRPRVLHGIGKQIHEDLAHQRGIAIAKAQLSDLPLNRAALALRSEERRVGKARTTGV